jgi:hypothetical protein
MERTRMGNNAQVTSAGRAPAGLPVRLFHRREPVLAAQWDGLNVEEIRWVASAGHDATVSDRPGPHGRVLWVKATNKEGRVLPLRWWVVAEEGVIRRYRETADHQQGTQPAAGPVRAPVTYGGIA